MEVGLMHEEECAEEHQALSEGQHAISQQVEELREALEYHIGQTHEQLKLKDEKDMQSLYDIVNALADNQLGPLREPVTLYGGARDYTQGTSYKVDEMWKQTQDGGIKVKVPWTFWTAVTAALVAGLFDVVRSFIVH